MYIKIFSNLISIYPLFIYHGYQIYYPINLIYIYPELIYNYHILMIDAMFNQ